MAALVRNIRHVGHVHISENHRGIPGTGHVPWAATFSALKHAGYDGWLTVEALRQGGAGVRHRRPGLARYSEGRNELCRRSYRHIRAGWDAA